MDKQFEIISWNPTASWSYNIRQEICFCRNNLHDKCLNCCGDNNGTSTKCPIAKGKCGHAFHLHCINKLLENDVNCPIDKTPFNFETYNLSANKVYIEK